MAGPAVTYEFTSGTTIASAQVNQNFDDAIAWGTSGSVDWTVAALSCTTLTASGAASFQGAVTLGNATGDDLTFTGYAASAIIPKTNQTYALGTADLGWNGIYLGVGSGGSFTMLLKASASQGADYTLTLPVDDGTAEQVLATDGSGVLSWKGIVDTTNGLYPADHANFSNAAATRLGLKEYHHGTNYNGGSAPTVTCGQSGFAVGYATFIPYQMQSGVWRCRANIRVTWTSATISAVTLAVNAIAFKSSTTAAGSGFYTGNAAVIPRIACESTTNIEVSSASATTVTGVALFFDVELASKPAWAY